VITYTPATTLLDDAGLIERILNHVETHTTDLEDDSWREPVVNYQSPARLDAEMHRVLRRHPTVFCPSAALPQAGSFIARHAAGVPLVVVRGNDGVVRAFRNACRHRGAAVASGSGCTTSFACPYHAWVYRLDGHLRHVPDEYGFPCIDKDARGLVAVGAEERAGLVFVTQDEPLPGATLDGLPDLISADQSLVDSSEMIVDVNWKVFVEGFLEGYHIKATHTRSFYPFGYDNLSIIESFGRNTRVTLPFRRIEKLRNFPVADRRIDGLVTCVYHLFPAAAVIKLTHHTVVVVVDPISVDRTNTITYMLTNHGAGDHAQAAAGRDREFVAVGAAEDREMALAVQRGFASRANDTLEFARFEGGLIRFHRNLHELLDGERSTLG
jgi:phenylpropionate dioxygenase-like ring-hydroxylating dioxygenase large terminal subunit